MVDNPSAAPLEIQCWADDLAACRGLAEVYEKGQDVTVDLDRARDLYEYSCKLGNTDGCVSLAQFIVKHADPPTEEILALLARLNEEGRTIVIVTHETEVSGQTKRTIVLHDGKILSDEKH